MTAEVSDHGDKTSHRLHLQLSRCLLEWTMVSMVTPHAPLSSTEASINHYYPIWTMVKPACIPEMTWIQPHLSISAIPHLPVFHKITDAALFSSSFNKKLWMDMKCNAENRAIMFRCQCLRWQMVKLNVRQLPTEEFTFSHCITEAYSHMSGFGNLKICYRCDHVTTVSTTD